MWIRDRLALLLPVAALGCGATEPEPFDVAVGQDSMGLTGGFPLSPTIQRIARLNDRCSATVIDEWWAISSGRYCLDYDKDPNSVTLTLGAQTRGVTHVAPFPENVPLWPLTPRVVMVRLDQPFTNISSSEMLFWPDPTSDLDGASVLCGGYGSNSQLTAGYFQVDDKGSYYLALNPNPTANPNLGFEHGDIGGTCRYGSWITGVMSHVAIINGVPNQARHDPASSWRDWAEKRRDCPGFRSERSRHRVLHTELSV